jgi:MFS family permease
MSGASSSRWMISLGLAAGLTPLNSTMISVALPAVGAEVSSEVGALTLWLVMSYVVACVIFQSPGGKLGDLFGHHRALRIGQLIFGAGAAVGFLAKGVPMLAGARLLMAGGGALIGPATMALVRTELPAERRPQAFGALAAVAGLASALGPFIGGELVTRFGWRTIFLLNVIPLGASWLMARGKAPEAPSVTPRFDVVGSVLLTVGLLLFLGATRGSTTARGVFLVLSLATLAGFARWERGVAEPVFELSLFRSRPFFAGALIIGLQNLGFYGLLFQIPFYLSARLHADATDTGRTLFPLMIMVIVFSVISGKLSPRLGMRWTALSGTLLSVAGVASLVWRMPERPRDVVLSLMVTGAGAGLAMPPSQAGSMSSVPAEKSGMAGAALTSSRYLGGVVGVSVFSSMVSGAENSLEAHRSAMVVFTIALALSGLACLWLPPRK